MKTVFIVLTYCTIICKCYQITEATVTEYNVPVINLRGFNECIVFMQENNTDIVLLNSLISGLFADQSVTLLTSGDSYGRAGNDVQNRDPDVIILSDSIVLEDFNPLIFKILARSFWSPMNLIITTKDGNLTCENGTINEEFFENLQVYMNKIWHKYQLIFAIISFPFTCPEHFIIYGGKKQSTETVYDRTIQFIRARDKRELKTYILDNFQIRHMTEGYPIRANIFSRFPTSITQCNFIDNYVKVNFSNSNGFCGMDGLMMHEFIDYYKYKLLLPSNEECNKYGFVDPKTNNATGSLGCILRKELDISFNSRFMIQYSNDYYTYLNYVSMDSLAVVLNRPKVIPLWKYPMNLYGLKEDLILAILIMILGVVAWVSARITREITRQKPQNFLTYIFNAFTCTLFGISIQKKAERFKILKGTSLFCSVILLAYYQGIVNYQFTTSTRSKEIRTLQRLYNSKNTLYTSPQMFNLLINILNPSDQAQVAFFNHVQIKEGKMGLDFVLKYPQTAVLSRAKDTKIEAFVNFADKSGSPLIYVVDEALHMYYLSYICRSDFLFVEESVRFMMHMLQAGLPNQFYSWTRLSLKIGDNYPRGPEPRPFKPIELCDVRIAYGVLTIGYLISTISFLLEMYKR